MSNSEKLDLLPGLWWLVDWSPWVALIAGLILSPGLMFGIQLMLEHRRPAPRYYQFKSFIYGDPALAVSFGFMVALAGKLPEGDDRWFNSGLLQLISVLGAATIFVVGRSMDTELYSKKQLLSPSKVYHDVVLFLGYGYLLIKVGVPAVFGTPWTGGALIEKIMVLGFWGVWALCLLHDSVQPKSRRSQLARFSHTSRYTVPLMMKRLFVSYRDL